jgi:ABC-2 type transport system ATP-binding protein
MPGYDARAGRTPHLTRPPEGGADDAAIEPIRPAHPDDAVTRPVIHATGLVKRYGDVVALDGLDLSVGEGMVLGLLGPNGAGKTTAVRIFATLLQPDEGSATVAGVDVCADPHAVRRRIGLSGQSAAVDEVLTGFENLDMVGRLYRLGRRRARARARELLDRFDLSDAGDRLVKTYSGGMRRRLDLAAALVAEPPVLFLDEPSTGLDPRSRSELWDVIRELVARGATVLLTTQYLEEADHLADDIVVIDHGRVIAQGRADDLKSRVGGERIEAVVADDTAVDAARDALAPFAAGDVSVERHVRRVIAPVRERSALRHALDRLDDAAVDVVEVGLRRPTLDDVFFALTGHAADVDGNGSADGDRAASESEDDQVPESRTPGRMRPAPPVTDPDANREEEPAR